MATKVLTLNEVLERIEEILKEPINKDLEFLGFVGGKWIGYKKTKITVKCKKHNITADIWFSNFSKNRKYRCPECIKEDLRNRVILSDEKCIENLKSKYKEFDFIMKGYKGSDHDVEVICPKHGSVGIFRYRSLIDSEKTNLCTECELEERTKHAIEKINEYVEKINQRPDRNVSFLGFVGGKYINIQTRLILRCNIHNITWDTTTYNNFVKDKFAGGCSICKGETTSKRTKHKPQEALQLVLDSNEKQGITRNLDYTPILTSYKDYHSKVTINCPIHGSFEIGYITVIKGDCYCPICNPYLRRISRMELYTGECIKKYYNKEIRTQELIRLDTRNVYVDFYLPEDNKIIEYDGRQHYEFVRFFHKSIEDFNDQVNRDNCLVEYCKQNNIQLLRIPWKDDSRLEEVVREFILNNNDISTKYG